jgi:carboxypeptidase D
MNPARALLPVLLVPILLAAKPAARPVDADGRVDYRMAVLPQLEDLRVAELLQLGFDLERNGEGDVVAFLTPEEMGKLENLGIGWIEIPTPGRTPGLSPDQTSYHNYTSLTTKLQNVANQYPAITRLVSAGTSVQGRELWWLKLTDNPDVHEDEPGFKYIATMHGDEPVGTELCLDLIDYLTQNYGSNSRVNNIVDNIELWIMPMMNPDGNALSQRYNSSGVDLNRDFPDQYQDPIDSAAGRAIETQRLMNWQYQHTTALSANLHTGALVVNYPYDSTASGASVYNATPDDEIFRDVSLDYSEDNAPMYNGPFPQGITNGADWYNVFGGMQDWNYIWQGDAQVTIEQSSSKWPAASQLPTLWNNNRESMLSYLERSLTGVRGIVTDASTGAPVRATLNVIGRERRFFSDPAVGDYHRILPAGTHQIRVEAVGYEPQTFSVTIANARATAERRNLQLVGLPPTLQQDGARVATDSGNANGWFDAGESGQLAVTLRNVGGLADNPHGQLRPLTRYAQVQSASDWPDIAAGQSQESLSPHAAIAVASDTPTGHKLAFAVDWNELGGQAGTTSALFVPVGAPETSTRPSTDTPQPITDNSTSTSSLTVSTDQEIAEVNVRVDLAHTYIGELRVTLIAPDGTQIRLHDQTGGSSDDIHTWYDTDTPPVNSLDSLIGRSTLGTWQLRVQDLGTGDTGSLQQWQLQLITRPWEAKLPEVLLRSVTKTVDAKSKLGWWPVGSAQSYRVYRGSDPRTASAFTNVTNEDSIATDLEFVDASPSTAGSLTLWLVSAVGHTGEGYWGHYGQ